MQRCAFTPYEGKKPYIFISYAHKDSDRVFPILEELDRRGYRVWYDDGIAPGSEWPENIAQHLDGCSLTLAFISPNSIASANCRREVTFALSKRKPFLGIVLQPTEMSLGMEMQLSAQQCIMKYTYTTDDDFFRKVCSCPDLEPCLGQPKVAAAAPIPVPTPAPVVAPAPVASPAPKVREKKPANKKLIGIVGAAAAAVAVIALVLVLVLGGGDGDNTLRGDPQETKDNQSTQGTDPADSKPGSSEPTGFTEETYLSYSDQVITAKDAAYISQQYQLGVLEMYNCVIQPGAFEDLKLAGTLTEITMENCTGVHNLHSLAGMEELASLKLINCGISQKDMPKLISPALHYVDISGNPDFYDLSVFEDCTAVEHINFSYTGVDSVEALGGMENLRSVNGSYTHVGEILPLCSLTNLVELHFAGCGLQTISSPFYSLRLETVDLSYNQLANLEALEYCTTLCHVDVSYNLLDEVYVLEKSAATLISLNISGNAEIYFFDLDFLNSCTNMEKLNLDGIYLTNLSTVSELVNLKYLSAVDCTIIDISDVRKLTNLEYLNLAFNRISDVTPLQNVVSYYQILDLSFNDALKDVSSLQTGVNFVVLNLTNNYLDPYTVPPVWGGTLVVAYNEAWMDEECMKEADRSIFGAIRMAVCPMDKIVAMENRFGADRIAFLQDEESYLAQLEELGIDCTYLRGTMLE